MNKFKLAAKDLWELPQNIIGAIVKAVSNAKFCTTYEDVNVYTWNMMAGLSLGKYIFTPFEEKHMKFNYVKEHVRHEYGHCLQSRMLGWFYPIIISLPSLLWAASFDPEEGVSYYSFYTERWADRLAGIDRENESENKK